MASTITPSYFMTYPTTVSQGNVQTSPQFMYETFPTISTSRLEYQRTPQVPTMKIPIVPVGGGYYNDGMEVVWHGEFSRLFCNFYPPHVWYISITGQAPGHTWKYHRDSAKVRFCCQDCGNGWTSMKGRVTFWFYLDNQCNTGFVQFKLYGQQCKKCNSGKFECVMWYPEEVSKVMCNIYNKVGQTYYGFQQPRIRIDRRPGRPRNQHNAGLCQACKDGECDQIRSNKTTFTYDLHGQSLALASSNPATSQKLSTPIIIDSSIQNPAVSADKANENVKISSLSDVNFNNALRSEAKPSIYNTPFDTTCIPVLSTPSPGRQQIITYSVIGGPPMPTSLSGSSTRLMPGETFQPPIVPQYIYHPSPMMHKTIPLYQPSMYPMLQHKPVSQTNAKSLSQHDDIETITKAMQTVEVSDRSDSCQVDQASLKHEKTEVASVSES